MSILFVASLTELFRLDVSRIIVIDQSQYKNDVNVNCIVVKHSVRRQCLLSCPADFL